MRRRNVCGKSIIRVTPERAVCRGDPEEVHGTMGTRQPQYSGSRVPGTCTWYPPLRSGGLLLQSTCGRRVPMVPCTSSGSAPLHTLANVRQLSKHCRTERPAHRSSQGFLQDRTARFCSHRSPAVSTRTPRWRTRRPITAAVRGRHCRATCVTPTDYRVRTAKKNTCRTTYGGACAAVVADGSLVFERRVWHALLLGPSRKEAPAVPELDSRGIPACAPSRLHHDFSSQD